ncbi:integrase [Primorskyibacter flagellatus]|uniref:Integrase n=1 Tax=Primorskyibacter flagellatus TaxID=1387277 RepID=A0A917EAZ0_9RHOB|nr:integrase arm-type DNA-binding domain-containing protein [Primorskyibacter flagellatus]GGE17344.1 integrase [Primorskyibacter flagellatus]
MPRRAKELKDLEVRRLAHPGPEGRGPISVAVGGVAGLHLQLTVGGGRSWLLRYSVGRKRRELGLGPYPEVTLAKAHEKARIAKDKITQGIDPIQERKDNRAALIAISQRMTFKIAADKYLDKKRAELSNPKHFQQWQNTLATYAEPIIGNMAVEDIATKDILRVLEPIWSEKTETATRLRARIEAVLSWATVSGYRSGDNPARWAGNLKELLPAPSKVSKTTNQPAVQIDQAPAWFQALRQREGMGSRALEYAILTAARSGEVRGATWDEIDLDKGIWTIPADRMKMDREHRVPLPPVAVDLLKALPRLSDKVFPAPRGGELSDMTLSATMKRIHEDQNKVDGIGFVDRVSKRPAVPHGLRSTFRDWVAEQTDFPGDMAEVALAHSVGNTVEAAYRRGDMVEKRRAMMQAWSEYLDPTRTVG